MSTIAPAGANGVWEQQGSKWQIRTPEGWFGVQEMVNGSWQAEYEFGRFSEYFSTRAEAQKCCEDYLAKLANAQALTEAAVASLEELRDEDRLMYLSEYRSRYCEHCGTADTNCQCWNDE